MRVDGFVTSRELYEVHNLTPALIRKFLPGPDAVALFEYSDIAAPGCDLYAENRVADLLKTEQFRTEWAKTERHREAARKGNVKRRETYEKKLKQEDEARSYLRWSCVMWLAVHLRIWVDRTQRVGKRQRAGGGSLRALAQIRGMS